ncbi:MAG: 4Fe-4S dicluster domain-containing protein [Acidimicrobiia bacterium]
MTTDPRKASVQMQYGFVIDQSTCIGCHACTVACKTEHQVPLGVNRTWVKYVEQGTWPETQRSFSVMRCNHCADAPCVTICPTSALFKRDDGIVDFNTQSCIGCKSCMQACPYDALYIDPNDNTAQKCNYCAHRVEVGIEPACVVVCPEQSIIAGDLDDPTSKIARLVAEGDLTQRAVERGTQPNLWYKDANNANIEPHGASRSNDGGIWSDPADIEKSWLNVDLTTDDDGKRTAKSPSPTIENDAGSPRVVYSSESPIPWGWRVSTYFLTKAISAGIAIAAAMALLFGAEIESTWMRLGAPFVGAAFLLATGVVLVWDLKRPDRFYYLLTKGNMDSWLVRGAWILTAQALAFAMWILAALAGVDVVTGLAIWIAAVIGLGTAGYTAFLFGQARGRELWNSSTLVWHMIAAAFAVGGGVSLIGSLASPVRAAAGATTPLASSGSVTAGASAFAWTMLLGAVGLGFVAAMEAMAKHGPNGTLAYHHMTRGEFSSQYLLGLVAAVVMPTIAAWALLTGGGTIIGALGGIAACVGVWLIDDAFVQAGQSAPLT